MIDQVDPVLHHPKPKYCEFVRYFHFNKMLECSVFVENNETPSLSFKRFVLGNVHVGLLDRNVQRYKHHYVYLCVVTSKNTLKYRVFENVKRVNSVQLLFGKISIEFCHPSHNVLIRSDTGKLTPFFRRFQILCDEEKMRSRKQSSIPLIPSPLKFVSKPKASETKLHVKDVIFQIPCPLLRKEVLKNAQVLHLPNSNLHDLPMQLGLINWSEINLENNNLNNGDLLWLEELPVRKTLTSLNLSKNKITSFPPALVDFQRLNFVNFRENEINYIPGTIGSFRCLRLCVHVSHCCVTQRNDTTLWSSKIFYGGFSDDFINGLNLSNNQIRYLPASIVDLRLHELDLTENYLTCSIPDKNNKPERKSLGATLRLEDLASVKIDSSLRRQLSNRECPRRLLEKLRCASQCICGKKSMPSAVNQCYAPLVGLNFSSSFSIHPQKSDQRSSIFLQYHFCLNSNTCDRKKYQRMNLYSSLT